jgi:hypothetical protein
LALCIVYVVNTITGAQCTLDSTVRIRIGCVLVSQRLICCFFKIISNFSTKLFFLFTVGSRCHQGIMIDRLCNNWKLPITDYSCHNLPDTDADFIGNIIHVNLLTIIPKFNMLLQPKIVKTVNEWHT